MGHHARLYAHHGLLEDEVLGGGVWGPVHSLRNIQKAFD